MGDMRGRFVVRMVVDAGRAIAGRSFHLAVKVLTPALTFGFNVSHFIGTSALFLVLQQEARL